MHRRLAGVIPGDAPERMVVRARHRSGSPAAAPTSSRSIPETGRVVRATIDIGASGIDVAVSGAALLIPTRSDAVDRSGFPTMDALEQVATATGKVTVLSRPKSPVDVHGLVAAKASVWLADNTHGRVYRVRVP